MMKQALLSIVRKWQLLLLLISHHAIITNAGGEYICDDDATHDNVKVNKLTPNMFHKICPKTTSSRSSLGGQPICGDGTPFAFFFTKPPQKKANKRKILIEFQGGGGCWDSTTCAMQSNYLTFPYQFDDFVGMSCSEINYGVSDANAGGSDFPINILCAQQIGNVDLTEYNTLVIPYCTQDVHVGDSAMEYDGGGDVILHHGAHNVLSVLRWIFRNFSNPSHIALTGCSAGGTVLPIAYDLLDKHYNSFLSGGRSTQISVISDSPVYLTPEYFLENSIEHWNPSTIMKRIRFNFEKNRQNEDYPTKVWDHVLKRGSNRDRWGLVTHTTDPISLQYYQWMSGNGDGDGADDDDDNNNNNGNDYSQWWSELSTSLSTIQEKHHNVDKFLIEDEGHCSFGLYYPLQVDGFEDWAASILHEDTLFGGTSGSLPLFLTSLVLGIGLVAGSLFHSKKKAKQSSLGQHDGLLTDETMISSRWWCLTPPPSVAEFFSRFKTYPITFGYFVATTFYFVSMLFAEGFAHPINNPSLGPSAQGLSSFGINNPTLIVYQFQIGRLITSNFLCSGVLTYLMVVFCLWRHTRYIEEQMNSHTVFSLVSFCILMGSNLLYAGVMNGASCASLSLVLGLNTFSIAMSWKNIRTDKSEVDSKNNELRGTDEEDANPVVAVVGSKPYVPPDVSSLPPQTDDSSDALSRKHVAADDTLNATAAQSSTVNSNPGDCEEDKKAADDIVVDKETTGFPTPWAASLIFFVLTCVLFPFNSWVMLLSAMAIGPLVGPLLFDWHECSERDHRPAQLNMAAHVRPWPWKIMAGVYIVVLVLLILRVRKPNEIYKYPYLTGCELIYTTDVYDIVSGYGGGGNDGQQRRLNDYDDLENTCAQLCVPHVACRPVLWGINKYVLFSIDQGMCEDHGYEEHVADKTFYYKSYSLDVELYSMSGGGGGEEERL